MRSVCGDVYTAVKWDCKCYRHTWASFKISETVCLSLYSIIVCGICSRQSLPLLPSTLPLDAYPPTLLVVEKMRVSLLPLPECSDPSSASLHPSNLCKEGPHHVGISSSWHTREISHLYHCTRSQGSFSHIQSIETHVINMDEYWANWREQLGGGGAEIKYTELWISKTKNSYN